MKKAYSHFALLVLAAASFSSCSRANYASVSTAPALATASPVQAPASPAADMSAAVVATKPLPAVVEAAPAVAPAPVAAPAAPSRRAAASASTAQASVAVADAPAARATKPTLVQRLALNKLTKQLSKIEKRQQNTAGVAQPAASSGSLTILLVGLVALLIGIIIGAGWLTTIGAIVALVGLVLLLLKAL